MKAKEDDEYWFARRFPIGSPRSAMGPVHWKGWVASALFVAVLGVGGILFAYFGATDRMMEGSAIFIVVAFVAATWFILLTRAKGDRVRTVADYKREKLRV